MQFSEQWLRSLVNPPLDSDALAHLLTMAGLEVEEMEAVAPAFDNVVVAQVLSVEKHPDADKLKLCRVEAGQAEPLQIVCGAPNVAAGMKVPCAMIGAALPGITIKKAKVRGIESFGMLCSARELGISEDDQGGLLALEAEAPVGTSIRDYLQLDDRRITLKLTPNRADCLSLRGIAREVAALSGVPLTLPEITAIPSTQEKARSILLDAAIACPRYCGRIITGVNARAATPDWMARRLERSGIRSISVIVDITNYVMLELGQPMHAFDNAHIEGSIHIRHPKNGEQLKLLNEQTATPPADMLLIADEANGGRALALAGIMGGADSGVTSDTTEIFLESAFFTPDAIAGRARQLGFSSDSSYRFERGVDFELPRAAIERASQLVLELCGGEAGPVTEATSPGNLPRRPPVRLRCERARKVLGVALTTPQIQTLLQGLGFPLERQGEEFIITPPAYRYDIQIEEDLIEEIARLHGYDNIPSPAPRGQLKMRLLPEQRRSPMSLRHRMADLGYLEVVNYSFVDAAWEADFSDNTSSPILLANPIASQMGVMRSSLIGGLVNTLTYNLKRRTDRVRIFEIGRCFHPTQDKNAIAGFHQPQRLAALCAGTAHPVQWGEKSRPVDFYDIKADLEAMLPNRSLRFEKHAHPALHPGRSARVILDGQSIGILGELHPAQVQKYELGTPPVVFEIDLAPLTEHPLPNYQPVSRFPSVERDLALLVAQEQAVQPLLDALRQGASPLIRHIELFDLYQGKAIDENKKSLAFRVVMQDTAGTLADAVVDGAIQELLAIATQKFNAALRS